MSLVIKDRVKETSTTTGTGTLTLAGATTGYQSFSTAIGNTNTTYYTISTTTGSEWEVGLGTVGAGTLARTTILASSNAGSAVNFSAGTKDVFGTYPAGRAVTSTGALTSGRVTYATTDGAVNDSANLTFNGTTLTANAISTPSFTNSGLTSGRVVYTTTGGLETSSANLTFDGTTVTTANDASISGLTVGKGNSAISTNTALGLSALAGVNTGTGNNVAIGYQAMQTNTSGQNLTAIGYQALNKNTSGSATAVGYLALYNNTTGSQNTAVGLNALTANTTGASSSAFGRNSLQSSTGDHNTGIGQGAGFAITSGTQNTVLGSLAGGSGTNNLTTGSNNIIIGYNAAASSATVSNEITLGNASVTSLRVVGIAATFGTDNSTISTLTVGKGGGAVATNTAVGSSAMAATATGGNNVAVGLSSLGSNTSGSENVAVGQQSLTRNTTAIRNTAVGGSSMPYNTTGQLNTAVGYATLFNNTTGGNNTAIGYQALQNTTTAVATLGSITGGSGGTDGTYTGVVMTLSSGSTATTYPTATIVVAGGTVTTVTLTAFGVGFKDTTTVLTAPTASIGNVTGFTVPVATLATGGSNTAVGYQALLANTTASQNVAVGQSALAANTTATSNTAIGFGAGTSTVTGGLNTFVGYQAGSAVVGTRGTYVGYQAGFNAANTGATYNTAVGTFALNSTASSTGYFNTAIGGFSLYTITTGNQNTGVGYGAGQVITSGTNNTLLGYGAGNTGTNNLTTGSNNTIIGFNAAASAAGVSNEVTIGNSSVTTTRLQGNLGVSGTQPAAWFSPNTNAIDMNYAALSFDSTAGSINLSSNLYQSAVSPVTWNVKTSASPSSTLYQQVNGAHNWFYAAPAAIGSAVTLVTQMTISTTGVLNFGNSSSSALFINTVQSSGGSNGINFCTVTSGTASAKIFALREGGSFANSLIFSTAVSGGTVTEALRIDSSQNVGIGVTPSAWSAYKVIDINTVSSVASTTTQLDVGFNYYWNGTNNIYKTSTASTFYRQNSGAQHQWWTAASGTAGNIITFVQNMTLDASGNLGIGIASPNANTKLDVNGPIRAKGYTVATLPTGTVGARVYVTDALSPTFLTALTGGGAVTCPAFYNGTAWVAG
jgi:hypothetical protein